MGDQFYGRQEEIRQFNERSKHGPSHQTMETYNLEQQRVHVEKPYTAADGDVVPPAPTLFDKMKGFFARLFGR
ncbi:MAG: hypothetical protein SF029_00065 [bacterium]|nr:hypothetical protein [bacterium]